jgi:hypothetical protein
MSGERWSNELLDQMRLVGDPLADGVIAAVVDSGETAAVDKIMAYLILNEGLVPQALPDSVREYLQQTASLPAWADAAQMAVAQNLFLTYAPEIVLLLFYSSLPTAYAARKGAQVLAITRRLEQGHIYRRIIETAQFIVDVMTPGAFDPQGQGIRAVQKVRLMHAAIRHYIRHENRWQVHWDPDWGTPINQEDLAGTLMTFSLIVMDGMRRFNIRLQPQKEEAYLHAWKVVGEMLGIQPELLPADMADARNLMDTILQRQWAPSEAGCDLTSALIGFLDGYVPIWLRGLPNSALRYFRGNDLADMLGVGRANWTTLLLQLERILFGWASHFENASAGFGRFARWLHVMVLNDVLSADRDGNRPPFRIPERLSPTGLRIHQRRSRAVKPRRPPPAA